MSKNLGEVDLINGENSLGSKAVPTKRNRYLSSFFLAFLEVFFNVELEEFPNVVVYS